MYKDNPLFDALLKKTASGAYGLQTEEYSLPGCVYENGTLYFSRFWKLKQALLREIEIRNGFKIAPLPLPIKIDERLNEAQRHALQSAFTSPTLLLQGGPGSGKTFTISKLIPLFLESYEQTFQKKGRILLAAQTAKAVHHLANQLGTEMLEQIEVRTIHKLLKLSKEIRTPTPTLIDHDLIIIDESSMLDADLMVLLLTSVSPMSRLIFVGDPQQLPPIEGGAPFKLLIEIKAFTHHFLPGSHRAENKAIIDEANALFNGVVPKALALQDFQIESILHEFAAPMNSLPESFPPFPRKILSSLRIGPHGSKELSKKIFEQLKELPGRYLLVPIMITQNNEQLKLFNGQEGIYIHDKKSIHHMAHFSHLKEPLPLALLPPYEISYAISIHKSQGSEYEQVDILLPESKEPLLVEHLYTAMTRAKKGYRLYAAPESLSHF
ncbi:MAG: ATP-dependent DNA helicase [Chlamydiia bacterium]